MAKQNRKTLTSSIKVIWKNCMKVIKLYGNVSKPVGTLVGWHIGVGFDYRIIHIAIEYGTDFNEIAEKSKFATTAITLGLNF